jgi:hypothetical protein
MGRLTNLNPPAPISDADLPASIARDAEYKAGDEAHLNASHPHPQYLLPAQGDARYRQSSLTQTFTSTVKNIGISSNPINSATAATFNKSGTEIQSADSASAAYISFHRPNFYGCHFGLDTNNTLAVGGWSFGGLSYKIWHELYGTPVWQAPSDRRLKKSVRPIPSALDLILGCQPISFQYNNLLSKEYFGDNFQREKIHYGFLADSFPLQDLVAEKPNGYLGLDYLEIIPFLCRAIQEQQEQIRLLNDRLELLNA